MIGTSVIKELNCTNGAKSRKASHICLYNNEIKAYSASTVVNLILQVNFIFTIEIDLIYTANQMIRFYMTTTANQMTGFYTKCNAGPK